MSDITERIAAAARAAGFGQATTGDGVEQGWTNLETSIELVQGDEWVVRTAQRGDARPSPSFTDRSDAERWMLAVFVRLSTREAWPAPAAVAAGWTASEDGRTVTRDGRAARFPFAGDARRFTTLPDGGR